MDWPMGQSTFIVYVQCSQKQTETSCSHGLKGLKLSNLNMTKLFVHSALKNKFSVNGTLMIIAFVSIRAINSYVLTQNIKARLFKII